MIKIFSNFFKFCGKELGRKMKVSMWLGVVKSFFEALRIPAVYVLFLAITTNGIKNETLLLSFGIMLISVLGSFIMNNKTTILQVEAGYGSCANKRMEIAEHLRYVPMGYFNKNSLGSITSITTNTLEAMSSVAARVIMMSTQGYLSTAVIVLMVLVWNWKIGAVLIAGILLFALVNTCLQKMASKLADRKYKSENELVSRVVEFVQGIAEVKAYNLTKDARKELDKAIDENTKMNINMELKFSPIMMLQSIIIKLTGIACVLLSIYLFVNGKMIMADCFCMIISSFMILAHMETAGNYSALLKSLNLNIEKVNEVLSIPSMNIKTDAESQKKPADNNIVLDDISFSYDKKKIIDGISLDIKEGSCVAFVGPSGSGKTTLCHLISRFWDIDSGKITIGGKDVKDYSMDALMKNFSFVFQNVYLFKDTIANNIAFGEPNASRKKIIEAAKKACCHEFIQALPDGYDTVIGEGGTSLSGGERQRLSIARAIMKDAPIIILDEATANVDPENEAELMAAIDELTKSKTIIMIAHRLKTVRKADQIFVIDNGKIAQSGTHNQLMKKEGIYKRFVNSREVAASWKLS